jgi:hypothetical protein
LPWIDFFFGKEKNYVCGDFHDYEEFSPWAIFEDFDKIEDSLDSAMIYLRTRDLSLEASEVQANAIIIADKLQATQKSKIHSTDSGYSHYNGLGTGGIVVSYRYSCGFLGGSFAGWGGYGISENEANTKNCIMSNANKFQIYPSAVFPTSSGSTSTVITNQLLNHNAGYGAIAIFSNSMYLDIDSWISSGDNQEISWAMKNGYSGGS